LLAGYTAGPGFALILKPSTAAGWLSSPALRAFLATQESARAPSAIAARAALRVLAG